MTPTGMSTLPAPDLDPGDESGPVTAEGLLRRRARAKPDAVAIVDPPNRRTLGLARPRSLTYGQADAAVDALAAYFIGLGLEPGDRVAMQIPNFVEAPLALLGAWRAGLVVAALPMLWRAMEIAKACDEIEPKALIGTAVFAGDDAAERLREVAATRLSVRFVLGFGAGLPDGVASLNEVIETARPEAKESARRTHDGPALITFTARADEPLVTLVRKGDELLAQGAMTVMALALDRSDIILNPYPLTGPIGFALGLAPWLIGGAALVQHHPFDYGTFVQQTLASGATVTALPGAVMTELVKDGVLRDPQCRLKRIGRVWSAPELAADAPDEGTGMPVFDLYPLGELASLVLPRETVLPAMLPLGVIRHSGGGDGAVFLETKLGGDGDILLRGPVVPRGAASGPAASDGEGFVATGLHGALAGYDRLRVTRDPALVYHGGFTIAVTELDGLYQAFPGFLDAACFVLPDPIVGDRIFGAVAPSPNAPVSLEALHRFLMERGVAPYKFPDKLLVVKEIPRGPDGRILREAILQQV